jgi:hypothetical protein
MDNAAIVTIATTGATPGSITAACGNAAVATAHPAAIMAATVWIAIRAAICLGTVAVSITMVKRTASPVMHHLAGITPVNAPIAMPLTNGQTGGSITVATPIAAVATNPPAITTTVNAPIAIQSITGMQKFHTMIRRIVNLAIRGLKTITVDNALIAILWIPGMQPIRMMV